jgi:hypothetical protein
MKVFLLPMRQVLFKINEEYAHGGISIQARSKYNDPHRKS